MYETTTHSHSTRSMMTLHNGLVFASFSLLGMNEIEIEMRQ